MNQSDAWLMIRRRAAAAGIDAPIGCHTFRATGITAYLANGGALELAQEMAAHESPREAQGDQSHTVAAGTLGRFPETGECRFDTRTASP